MVESAFDLISAAPILVAKVVSAVFALVVSVAILLFYWIRS